MKEKSRNEQKPVCIECPAYCCRDLAISITKPRTKSEIEETKWYLHFDTVSIFIRNRRWHLLVKGKCIYLDDNNLCSIYEKRPEKCRKHNPPDCERYGKFYDVLISTPEELEKYLNGKRRRRPTANRNGGKKRRRSR